MKGVVGQVDELMACKCSDIARICGSVCLGLIKVEHNIPVGMFLLLEYDGGCFNCLYRHSNGTNLS